MILLERKILAIIATLFAVIFPILAITSKLTYLALVPILIFFGRGLLFNPSRLLVLALLCTAIQLKSPIGRFMMADILFLLFSAIVVVNIAMHKSTSFNSDKILDKLSILFLINMIVIIIFRGSGLAILGDIKVGGGAYILWISSIAALYFCKYISLSYRQSKYLIIGWLLLPLLNPLLEWLTIKTGGAIYPITQYFNIKFGTLYQAIVTQDLETIRAGTVPISVFFQILSLLVLARKQSLILFSIFAILGGIAILFTGFRSYLVAYAIVTFVSAYFLTKNKNTILTFALVSTTSLYISLLLLIDYVSFAIQRAVSFIPGLKVEGIALENALETTTWRIEIWQLAIRDFWNYAFVGRGLAWEIKGWSNLFHGNWYQTPAFFYANHNYHSGPITLIIDYGLPGTILWLMMQIYVIKQFRITFIIAVKNASKSIICSFYTYGFIMITWDVIHFWFIYGQTSWMQKFISYIILLKLLQVVIERNYRNTENSINTDTGTKSLIPLKISNK